MKSHGPDAVQFAGGHRIAVETETVVKSESIWNTAGSLIVILPLLYLVFRSLWLVTVGSLPSGLSLVFVLGAIGFMGAKLSAAATGAAAMLFGLGVDGVVLLYVAHRLALAEGQTGNIAVALEGPSTSMLLGMWTTAATFYGLMFVDFPSLEQLGRLLGHSMMVCGSHPDHGAGAAARRAAPCRAPAAAEAGRVDRQPAEVLIASAVLTVVLGFAATRMHVNPTLDRLRSVTDAAQIETRIGPQFGLPSDVYIVLAEGPQLETLLQTNERLTERLIADIPDLAFQPPARLLPSMAAQQERVETIRKSHLSVEAVRATLERARAANDFTPGAFEPFSARLPKLFNTGERITYDGYTGHGLGDLVDRFVVFESGRWSLATYLFPANAGQASRIQGIVDSVDPSQSLTGLTLVNHELARSFVPQFIKGLSIGTLLVVGLVVIAFRDWRLSMYALLPTAIGLTWAAGALALAGVELDLFAVFAVVTFVGIGVDYGIHLVHRYHERGNAERATAELAPVILSAAGITLGGYGTLIWSSYPPLRSIGIVSAASTVALAAASVLVLPALLLGRTTRGSPEADSRRRRPERDDTSHGAVIPAFDKAGSLRRWSRRSRGGRSRHRGDDGSRRIGQRSGRGRPARSIVHGVSRGKGHAVRSSLARVFDGQFTHVLLLDRDMQHLPEAAALVGRAARGAVVVSDAPVRSRSDAPARYHANRIGSASCRGSWACRSRTRVRLPRLSRRRTQAAPSERHQIGSKPKCW